MFPRQFVKPPLDPACKLEIVTIYGQNTTLFGDRAKCPIVKRDLDGLHAPLATGLFNLNYPEIIDPTKTSAFPHLGGGDRRLYRRAAKPFQRIQMKGIGYFHPEWFHGNYHGALRVEREDFVIEGLDPHKAENAAL